MCKVTIDNGKHTTIEVKGVMSIETFSSTKYI